MADIRPRWAREHAADDVPGPAVGVRDLRDAVGYRPESRKKAWRDAWAELEAVQEALRQPDADGPALIARLDELQARMAGMDPADDERQAERPAPPLTLSSVVQGRTVREWMRRDVAMREPAMPFEPGFHFASWRKANRP